MVIVGLGFDSVMVEVHSKSFLMLWAVGSWRSSETAASTAVLVLIVHAESPRSEDGSVVSMTVSEDFVSAKFR